MKLRHALLLIALTIVLVTISVNASTIKANHETLTVTAITYHTGYTGINFSITNINDRDPVTQIILLVNNFTYNHGLPTSGPNWYFEGYGGGQLGFTYELIWIGTTSARNTSNGFSYNSGYSSSTVHWGLFTSKGLSAEGGFNF